MLGKAWTEKGDDLLFSASWDLYPDSIDQRVEKATVIGTIKTHLILVLTCWLRISAPWNIPAEDELTHKTAVIGITFPLLGVSESTGHLSSSTASHLQEWRSQDVAYMPNFYWEVTDDASTCFGSQFIRETTSPVCQKNRTYAIPLYTQTAI